MNSLVLTRFPSLTLSESYLLSSFILAWIYLDFVLYLFQLVKSPFDLLLAIGHHPLYFYFVCYFDNGADGINLPALESSSSSESLATFRAHIAADYEADIFNRIRHLEAGHYYNLPPQTRSGEYEAIVRDHFDQAIHVDHLRSIMDMEFAEVQILEKKALLQEKLVSSMIYEPKIDRILELSPYQNVRAEAFHFVEEQVEPLNDLKSPSERRQMNAALSSLLTSMDDHGRASSTYKNFYSHFIDEEFRRINGLPLP